MKQITDYFKPTTIDEAARLLRKQPGRGKFIAGGTNLVAEKDPSLTFLVDVRQLGLDYIIEDGDMIRIGAATTIETIYHSETLNRLAGGLFAQVAAWFGSKQIRNMATLGGNVADGHPAADMIPPLLALDAQVVIMGESERIAPLADFLKREGGTILQKELITEFRIPTAFIHATGAFLKHGATREDIAVVSVAATVIMREGRCEQARIALGAVAPTAMRIPDAEAALTGQIPTPELIDQAAETVMNRIQPIDNFRASAAFRREISRTHAARALRRCCNLPEEQPQKAENEERSTAGA